MPNPHDRNVTCSSRGRRLGMRVVRLGGLLNITPQFLSYIVVLLIVRTWLKTHGIVCAAVHWTGIGQALVEEMPL
jgi:hypothetical protein